MFKLSPILFNLTNETQVTGKNILLLFFQRLLLRVYQEKIFKNSHIGKNKMKANPQIL